MCRTPLRQTGYLYAPSIESMACGFLKLQAGSTNEWWISKVGLRRTRCDIQRRVSEISNYCLQRPAAGARKEMRAAINNSHNVNVKDFWQRNRGSRVPDTTTCTTTNLADSNPNLSNGLKLSVSVVGFEWSKCPSEAGAPNNWRQKVLLTREG